MSGRRIDASLVKKGESCWRFRYPSEGLNYQHIKHQRVTIWSDMKQKGALFFFVDHCKPPDLCCGCLWFHHILFLSQGKSCGHSCTMLAAWFCQNRHLGEKCAESCSPTNINNHFFKFFRLIMINRLQAKLGSCFTSFLAKTDVGALLGY